VATPYLMDAIAPYGRSGMTKKPYHAGVERKHLLNNKGKFISTGHK